MYFLFWPPGLDFFDEVDRIGQSFQTIAEANKRSRDRNPLHEVKEMWANLLSRMDSLEASFDRAAERARKSQPNLNHSCSDC